MPVELTDGVVLLAAPTVADVERIAELCQDPDVARWTRVPAPYSVDDAAWFVSAVAEKGWSDASTATWGIRDPETRRLVGMVGVGLTGDPEVGFWMGASTRGRGWTTRAVRMACAHAFSLGVDHVRWMAITGNEASWSVARRVGFTLDGSVRRLVEQRGVWHDGRLATLLPDELS